MSNLPDTPTGWAVVIALTVVLLGAERLAIRWGWLKPEDKVHPVWAFTRFRLLTLALGAVGLVIYFLFVERG